MLPDQITAGDSFSFTESHNDYLPADGWVISYVLVSATEKITLNSTDNGDQTHLFSKAPADTQDWVAGHYDWQRYAIKGTTDRISLSSGKVTVLADFAAVTTGLDARSDWQTIYDNLLAAYKKLTTTSATVVSVSFGDRTTTYRDAADLLTQINNARQQVKREAQENALREGLPSGNKINFRF